MNSPSDLKLPDDFSLVQGGPLFQFFVRSRLSTGALGLLKRRIIFFVLLTWLPLLLLSALSGHAWGGGVQVPFLQDLETHARFLVALPLLLVTEWVVHQRLKPVVLQFIERGIITAEMRPLFGACITSAQCLRNSMFVEIVLLVLVLTLGHSFFFEVTTIKVTTWYATGAAPNLTYSPAGYWLAYVGLPMYQFIYLRWLFRFVVWSRFLWQVSRLNLYLLPTHPDRAGGLGFLAGSAAAFMPFLLSQGVLVSAMIAERILYEGAILMDFKPEIAVIVVFLLLLVLGPLCVFAPLLAKTKRQGLLTYGALASRYVSEFDKKWLQGGAAQDEAFIGSGDIQSLADLNNSIEVVRSMQVFPFSRQTVLQTAVVALLPLLPLLLTMISLEDLVKRLIGILL
ncbi:hypothetical protein [Methylomicrobium sp. Wu6]|uniref:hypothetical protein n=1 Tax=Methylomicrobium sp. Wu6 TaxID=3107928 RepID=UPI002DD6948B|nr:hypothetical protein [Methylomicrobium sp. Wu6]MEC4749164.1 hypothetical protein [Methylomicrobium sp. Wu6]